MNKEKLQKKDGKASGKSRKNKKYIKEMLEELLLMDLPACKLNEDMQKLGIAEDDISIQKKKNKFNLLTRINKNMNLYS